MHDAPYAATAPLARQEQCCWDMRTRGQCCRVTFTAKRGGKCPAARMGLGHSGSGSPGGLRVPGEGGFGQQVPHWLEIQVRRRPWPESDPSAGFVGQGWQSTGAMLGWHRHRDLQAGGPRKGAPETYTCVAPPHQAMGQRGFGDNPADSHRAGREAEAPVAGIQLSRRCTTCWSARCSWQRHSPCRARSTQRGRPAPNASSARVSQRGPGARPCHVPGSRVCLPRGDRSGWWATGPTLPCPE